MIRTILVPLAEELNSEPVLDAALLLAKRTHSHIRAMFIRPDPETALAYMPKEIISAGATREAVERETRRAARAEKARFEKWQTEKGVPTVVGQRLEAVLLLGRRRSARSRCWSRDLAVSAI